MCSLMEKDALIEKVATTMAFISRHNSDLENPDNLELGRLSSKIYSSKPEDLNFEEIVNLCDRLQIKYQGAVKNEALEFLILWQDLLKKFPKAQAVENPKGFVLGGQPGAGKSRRLREIINKLDGNLLIINGDEIRRYHPQFEELQELYADEVPIHTAEFAGKMSEQILLKALNEKYNIAIEGTFRTAHTPLKTLELMKNYAYETIVQIQSSSKTRSWQNCLDRYEAMKKAGLAPRAVNKAHHDLVCETLPNNADTVLLSGKADTFELFFDELIFCAKKGTGENSFEIFQTVYEELFPSSLIRNELNNWGV